ncbi:uncharacterized protein LOC123876468 [Maniola jurtina]|uniref:uncharacterized protein LOC123876468 n=1 Tax=Maniola jurtina TaxID=191418 RepID=UPI001E68B0F0|nr:uncharacterized protein LOC123876468 [Maniola jurtina]
MVHNKCHIKSEWASWDAYRMSDLMDMVYTTAGVMLVMLLLICLCCVFMKISDLKLQRYIVQTAKQKGLNVDLDKLNPRYRPQSPHAHENCTIMVPDVGIVL